MQETRSTKRPQRRVPRVSSFGTAARVGGSNRAALAFFPPPPCEIRKLHRSASTGQRLLAQRTGRGPCGRIIHVEIRWKPLSHALHEPVHQDKVHSAMPTELSGDLALSLPERMFEFFLVGVDRSPALPSRLSIKVEARRVVFENAFRSRDRV